MKTQSNHFHRGFTLIELMLSTAVLALLMLLFVSMVEQTGKIWTRTSSKVSQFQATRVAFDAMTRNLSQATLNTYWQPDPPRPIATAATANSIANWSPSDYVRASDLHFVTGRSTQSDLLGTAETTNPTHTVFFQAPLGTTGEPDPNNNKLLKYDRLDNMLAVIGYYVEWGADTTRPPFLDAASSGIPPRYRFRLMQARQEGEDLALFGMNSKNAETPTNPPYKPTDWVKAALGKKVGNWVPPASGTGTRLLEPRVMAENIVALVLMPKTSNATTGAAVTNRDLSPDYKYDSRPAKTTGVRYTWNDLKSNSLATERQWFNQLPPVVQVTMVAIDEQSAQRIASGTTAPNWTVGLFTKADKLEDDLNTLEATLQAAHINYRIFSTDVVIRGSKWTRPEK